MTKRTIRDLADLASIFPSGDEADVSAKADATDAATPTEADRATALAKLHVHLEKKGRKGKGVTVVRGFFHTKEDMEQFARELKTRCGSGGTVKNDAIEIQGDHRDTVAGYFRARGFKVSSAP
jgi:translation initiation factor 1